MLKIDDIRRRLQQGMTITRDAVSKGLSRHTILLPQHVEALEAISGLLQHSQRKQAFQTLRLEILAILQQLASYHDDHKIVILDALTNLIRFSPNVRELYDSTSQHRYIDIFVSLLRNSPSDGVVWATCNVLEYMLIDNAENARLLRRRRGIRAIVDLFARATAETLEEEQQQQQQQYIGEDESEEQQPLQDPSLGCLTAATRVLKRFVQCKSASTYFNKYFLVVTLDTVRHVSILLEMVADVMEAETSQRPGRPRSNAVLYPVRPGGDTMGKSGAAAGGGRNKKRSKGKKRKNELPLSVNEQERLREEAIISCIDFLESLSYPFEEKIRSQLRPLEPIVAFMYRHLEHLNAKSMEKVLNILAILSQDEIRVIDLERTLLLDNYQRKSGKQYESPLHALMLLYISKDKLADHTSQIVGGLLANVCHRKSEHALDLLCRPNIGRLFAMECYNRIHSSKYSVAMRAHSMMILVSILSKDAHYVDSRFRHNLIRTVLSILALTTISDDPEVDGLIKTTKLDAMRVFVILRPSEDEFSNMDVWNEYFTAIEKHVSDHVVCTWLLQFCGNASLSQLDRTDDLVLETIVHVLKNLITHERANERTLFDLGITLSLVRLLESKPLLRSTVLYIVRSMASSNAEFCIKFVRLGGLDSLLPLVIPWISNGSPPDSTESDHWRTSVLVVKTMSQLISKSRQNQLLLAELGVLPKIHELLVYQYQDQDSRKLQRAAIDLLRHLSDHEIVAKWIGAMGLIPVIVQIVKKISSAKVIERLTMTLLNLSHITSRRSKKQIMEASDIFARLLDSPNPNVQENVAILISNLATVPSLRKKMRSDTAILFALQRLIENEDIYLSQAGETALNCFNISDTRSPVSAASMRKDPTDTPKLMKRFDSFRGFSLTDFENRKTLIDVQYKSKFESAVQQMLQLSPGSITVTIDWHFFDTVLKERDDTGRKRSRALHLIQKRTWINLKEWLGQFADQSQAHTFTLQKHVAAITVSIGASGSVDFDHKQRRIIFTLGYDDLNPMSGGDVLERLNTVMWSEIEQSEMVKGKNAPVSRDRLISTTRNVEELRKNDPVQWMKVLANSSHQGDIFLGHLLELLEKNESGKFYRMASSRDIKHVENMRQQLERSDERLLRAWKVVTVDKRGIKQDRLLLLSNTTLHAVRCDAITGKNNTLQDGRQSRQYKLADYHLIDVGHYNNESGKPAMVIYTKARSQMSVPPILRLPSLISTSALPSGARRKRDSSGSSNNNSTSSHTSVSSSNPECAVPQDASKGRRHMLHRHDRTDTISHIPFDQLVQASTEDENVDGNSCNGSGHQLREDARPSLEDVHTLVIVPPGDLAKSMQPVTLLTEIAWTMFAAACASMRFQVRRPYENQAIEKPKKTVASSLYNRLKGKK